MPVVKAPCPGTGIWRGERTQSSESPILLSTQAYKRRGICCLHSACADLSVLQPSQKVFLESQLQLGPVMLTETEIVAVLMGHQKWAWTSEDKKPGYKFQAACALKVNKKNNA